MVDGSKTYAALNVFQYHSPRDPWIPSFLGWRRPSKEGQHGNVELKDGKEDWKDRRDEWNWEKGQGLTKGKSKRNRGGKGKNQGKPLDTASSQTLFGHR